MVPCITELHSRPQGRVQTGKDNHASVPLTVDGSVEWRR